MLDHARAGEWEQVIQLERTRQTLIRTFFNTHDPQQLAGTVAEGIRQVIETDREVMQFGKNSMQGIRQSLEKLSTGKQATAAYSQTA